MNFSEIFKNCPYKGEKVQEGFYKGIYICTHSRQEKIYCSMNCPVLKEYDLVDVHMKAIRENH